MSAQTVLRCKGVATPDERGTQGSRKVLKLLAAPTVVEQSNKIRNLICPTGAKVPFSVKGEFLELSNLPMGGPNRSRKRGEVADVP
jgi:hypothetical protein